MAEEIDTRKKKETAPSDGPFQKVVEIEDDSSNSEDDDSKAPPLNDSDKAAKKKA